MKIKNILSLIMMFLVTSFIVGANFIIATAQTAGLYFYEFATQLAHIQFFAKFKSFIFSEIRGKVNGLKFSSGPGGSYVSVLKIPTNPNTTAQSNVRADFTNVAQAWRDLTEAQRASWNESAGSFTHINVFGDNRALSGFGVHQQLNLNILAVNGVVIDAPPLAGAVFNFSSASLAADFTLQTMTLTYAPVIPATESVILKATAPQSAGKNFVKSELRQIDVILAADVSPFSIETEYIAKFGAVGAVGSKVFVEMKSVVTLTGLPGGRRLVSTITTV